MSIDLLSKLDSDVFEKRKWDPSLHHLTCHTEKSDATINDIVKSCRVVIHVRHLPILVWDFSK